MKNQDTNDTKSFALPYSISLSVLILLSFGLFSCQQLDDQIEEEGFLAAREFSLDKAFKDEERLQGNIKFSVPEDNPGAPFYMRMGPLLNQFFVKDGWLVIPFTRDPSCIDPDFNLLDIFDVPRAFSCELKLTAFGIIEADAPQGTFPIIVHSSGTNVPFWFVPWAAFQMIADDGIVTIGDIEALDPVKGKADKFKEMLRPRMENHHVQINASGKLDDGRSFAFHVTHVGDQTKSIGLRIR